MRIGELVASLLPFGLEKIAGTLTVELISRGHGVVLYCFDEMGPLAGYIEGHGGIVRYVPRQPGIDWSLPVRLAKKFNKDRIELLHCHNETAFFYGFLASILSRVPVVYTNHTLEPEKKILKRFVHSIFYKRTSKITAVAKEIEERMIQKDGAPKSRTCVIWNGVDGEKYRPRDEEFNRKKREELGIPWNSFIIGTVGRFSPEKNLGMLLKVLSLLPLKEELILLMVGNGSIYKEINSFAETLGLREKVILTGFRSDTEEIYPVIDLYAMASLVEGMPLSIIEAMACGRPVIATDVGGVRNIVKENVTGFLVPSGDVQTMVDRIQKVREDSHLRFSLGRNGRIYFENNLSEKFMVEKYEKLFHEIVTK